MKSFIVFALFVAVALAGPLVNPKDARIVRYDFSNIGVDGFQHGYESDDGSSVSAEGVVKNLGTDKESLEVRGQYTYIGTDNLRYLVTYIANELGYQPSPPQIIPA